MFSLAVPLFVAALPGASQSRPVVRPDRPGQSGVTAATLGSHATAPRPVPLVERRLVPAPTTPFPGAAKAIDAILGQLETHDEALLRAPFLAMSTAGAKVRSARDPDLASLVSVSATMFAARLNEVRIPERTRAILAAHLAAYEHDLLDADTLMLASSRTGLSRR